MSLPRNVRLLGLASLLNDIASETIYPLMPEFFTKELGGSKALLGLMEGIAETVASLLKLWFGKVSDRIGGRKSFVLLGYGFTALLRPLVGLANMPWQVMSIRIADKIGKGVRTAPRDALIADSTNEENRGRAFGFHRAMDHLGAAIGPALALVFLYFFPSQLRTLFLLTLIPGFAVVLLLTWGLKEVPHVPSETPELPTVSAPMTGNFRWFLVSMVVFTLGNSSDSFLLLRAGELGLPTWMLPVLWGLFHVVKSAASYAAGNWIGRLGAKPMIVVGWVLYALVYLAFAMADSAWQVWPLFFVYALHYALTEPAEKTLVAQLIGAGKKGAAYGWYNMAIGIAALPASAIFGWLYQQAGPLAAFGLGSGLAVVAAGMLSQVRPRPAS